MKVYVGFIARTSLEQPTHLLGHVSSIKVLAYLMSKLLAIPIKNG
jgi:hypothetical protein